MAFQAMLAERLTMVRANHHQHVFPEASPRKFSHQLPDTVVYIADAVVVKIHRIILSPLPGERARSTIGRMHVKIVEHRKEGAMAAVRLSNPIKQLTVDFRRSLPHPLCAPAAPGTLLVGVENRLDTQPPQQAFWLAVLSARQINPGKLASVECAHESIGG